MSLAFNAADHTYTFNRVPVPGVTTVLNPYNALEHVDPDYLAMCAEFGTHVHDACDLLNKGVLDHSSLTDAVRAYLAGWEKFLDESGFVVVESELKVYHSGLGYAGTLDNIGHFPKRKEPVLVDIKTGATMPKTVGPQTASYSEAWATSPGRRRLKRFCCLLKPEGYILKPLNDPNDFNIFKAALTLHRWQTGQ